MIQHRLLNTIF